MEHARRIVRLEDGLIVDPHTQNDDVSSRNQAQNLTG
jgi:hypothetical protein